MDFSMQISNILWRHILDPIRIKLYRWKELMTLHMHNKFLSDWLRNDGETNFWNFVPCKWMGFFETLTIFCDVISWPRILKLNRSRLCVRLFNRKYFHKDKSKNLEENRGTDWQTNRHTNKLSTEQSDISCLRQLNEWLMEPESCRKIGILLFRLVVVMKLNICFLPSDIPSFEKYPWWLTQEQSQTVRGCVRFAHSVAKVHVSRSGWADRIGGTYAFPPLKKNDSHSSQYHLFKK